MISSYRICLDVQEYHTVLSPGLLQCESENVIESNGKDNFTRDVLNMSYYKTCNFYELLFFI